MKCKFCEAENEKDAQRCYSCNAPLPIVSDLSDKDIESLTNYVRSVENMLKIAKKKGDGRLFTVFFLLSVVWVGLTILVYKWFESGLVFTIIFSIVVGAILFIVFGASVGINENKAMRAAFDSKIKKSIQDYLEEMHFTETDFQTVAASVLDEKSPLNNFLPDL